MFEQLFAASRPAGDEEAQPEDLAPDSQEESAPAEEEELLSQDLPLVYEVTLEQLMAMTD